MNRSKAVAAATRAASKHAPVIRKAIAATVDPDAIVDAWDEEYDPEIDDPEEMPDDYDPEEEGDDVAPAPKADKKKMSAWVLPLLAVAAGNLKDALKTLHTDGYEFGNIYSNAEIGQAIRTGKPVGNAPSGGRDERLTPEIRASMSVDWDNWKPGNPSADLLESRGLQQLLDDADITIKSLADTTANRLGTILADALDAGLPPSQVADQIREMLSDPSRAEMIAQTEMSRAIGVSTLENYASMGIEQVSWLSLDPCDECQRNDDASPIDLGDEFPSGDTAPPAHPNCRCTLTPVVPGYDIELSVRPDTVKYSEDQPRDEHGRFTNGFSDWSPTNAIPDSPKNAGGLNSKTKFNWEHGPDGNKFLPYIRQQGCRLMGLPVPTTEFDAGRYNNYMLERGWGAPSEKDVIGMVNSIANSKEQPELYRGMGGNSDELKQLASIKPGDSLDMPLVSATRSPGVALWYANDRASSPDEVPVLMKIQQGANGVNIGDKGAFFPQDHEVVVNGKFEVVSNSEVSMPYWSRDSVELRTDARDGTVTAVSGQKFVSDDVGKEVLETLRANPDSDLSQHNTETVKFTNDRNNPAPAEWDKWGGPTVSAWVAKGETTFRVIELKQVEVFKVANNG